MSFVNKISTFNGMYNLPVATHPTIHQLGVPVLKRLNDLKVVLQKELNELDLIIHKADALTNNEMYVPPEPGQDPYFVTELELLTDIADLMGDFTVYAASEMAKFGLPWSEILSIIMDSNFSKLGEDGLPILDGNGKVQKGPNYWKPEPKISALLEDLRAKAGVELDAETAPDQAE